MVTGQADLLWPGNRDHIVADYHGAVDLVATVEFREQRVGGIDLADVFKVQRKVVKLVAVELDLSLLNVVEVAPEPLAGLELDPVFFVVADSWG